MTGPTFASADEVALCLNCTRSYCDGGDATCAWGRVHWYEQDKAYRRAYMREYDRLHRRCKHERDRARRRREIG